MGDESKELTVAEIRDLEWSKFTPFTPDDVKKQADFIQEVMEKVFQPGIHYGIISEGMKPSLLKAGAEKMNFLFRIRQGVPTIEEEKLPGGHLEVKIITPFMDSRGKMLGYGYGSCTTMESKYRFRRAERVCPSCGQATIIKGKKEFGGGWLCWQKKGGCGEKFPDDDERIVTQETGKTENENIADTYNTVRKIAKKRSYVDGTLTVTGCSDFFTQDLEDMSEEDLERLMLVKKKPTADKPKSEKTGTNATATTHDNPVLNTIYNALIQRAGHGTQKNDNTAEIMARRLFKKSWAEIKTLDRDGLQKICFEMGIIFPE